MRSEALIKTPDDNKIHQLAKVRDRHRLSEDSRHAADVYGTMRMEVICSESK